MTGWRNWSGSVVANPALIARPRDEAELAAVVGAARAVRVTGAGHSFMPLCETEGTLVSLDDMAGRLVVAPDRRSVDAPAGWSLKRLTEQLWAQGLSLPNQGDVNPQSLGGALATGTHGTGRDLGSLATLAQSFRLVTSDGEVVECDRTTDPELFEAQRLSLGLLGIAVSARITVIRRSTSKSVSSAARWGRSWSGSQSLRRRRGTWNSSCFPMPIPSRSRRCIRPYSSPCRSKRTMIASSRHAATSPPPRRAACH
jgi:FAD/FMN-containing dehydrogenase